jgi:hypothetical protein
MVIPQFTLIRLLAAITVASAMFWIISRGLDGQPWAIGISAGFVSLILLMVILGATFGSIWMLAALGAWAQHRPLPEPEVSDPLALHVAASAAVSAKGSTAGSSDLRRDAALQNDTAESFPGPVASEPDAYPAEGQRPAYEENGE